LHETSHEHDVQYTKWQNVCFQGLVLGVVYFKQQLILHLWLGAE
jgi:hypothetical protein